MSSYLGRHAELYDLFYADKPYEREAAFVDERLRAHAAPGAAPARRILELACGTGRHALLLEGLGYEVTAIDHSADMLAVARHRAAEAGSRADFRLGDLRGLAVPGAPFDAAVCLFDALGYVATNDALLAALRGVRRHLRPDGLFVFEFWHAAAMLRSYDPVRVRRFAPPGGGEVVRISETRLDVARQLGHVAYTVIELRADGAWRKTEETQTNRYFLVQEMAGWLASGGFEPVSFCDGFRAAGAITSDTWHVVAVARAAGRPEEPRAG